MALLFMDSFDHYAIGDIGEKYTAAGSGGASIQATGGRRGGGCWRRTSAASTDYLTKALPASGATILCGVAVQLSAAPSAATTLLAWKSGATQQVTVLLRTDGRLDVLRGDHTGTLLGTTASALAVGAFTHIQVKILLHASAGTVLVKLNDAAALTLTGVNTASSGVAWDTFTTAGGAAGLGGITIDYDDLYLLDGSGSAPWNDLLGDCRVDVRSPTAAGATTGWTPSTGTNWAAVDDAAPNDDTDYTETATVGAIDTFVTQDAPVVGATLFGVQHCLSMKKTDAGVCTIATVIRSGGTNYTGAGLAPGTSYAYGLQIAATNPATGAQWTEAGFNAAEFGYTRTA